MNETNQEPKGGIMSLITKKNLIRLQNKHKTDAKIALLFGVTRQAIHQLRNKYGVAAIEDKKKDRNENIVKARKNGESYLKLASKYKVSVSQIYRIIGRY